MTTPNADEIRDQLLCAIDFNYVVGVLGYSTPEELLVAYDTSRTPQPDGRAAVYAEAADTAKQIVDRLVADGHEQRALGAYDVEAVLRKVARMAEEAPGATDGQESAVDRAAVLLEAANALDKKAKDLTSEFYNRNVLHEDGPFATVATWKCAADLLRRMADQAQQDGHVYLSTSCLHGEHGYCQSHTGLSGAKKPSRCKFCEAPCVCDCHQTTGAQRGAEEDR